VSTSAIAPRRRAKRSMRRSSGGGSRCTAPTWAAMEPTSVCAPVATTRPRPRPDATMLPAKPMLRRSARGVSAGSSGPSSFSTGTDSPVSTDSSMRRPRASTNSASAPTRIPDSSTNRSPGTNCSPSISRLLPPRRTRARVRTRPERACTSRSARYSFTNPMVAFSSSTAAMNPASPVSPSVRAMVAAASST
jgi:hypothetical protein